MCRTQCLVACFLVYFALGDADSVSFIKPCKPDDAACIKASTIAAAPHVIAGIPELGVPSADPIILNDVRADDKDLKLGFRNMQVTGIKNSKVLDIVRDLKKSTIKVVLESPLRATGQYNLDGNLLFIHAEGDGDFVISTNKVKIEVTAKVKAVEHNGQKHWRITGFDYGYDIIDNASIVLKNLFGGDENRAKPIQEILTHSSKEIIAEVGAPIIKEIVSKEVEIVNKLFKAIPASDLELS